MNSNRDLPTYQCSAYRRQVGCWRFVDDAYRGADAWFPRDELGGIRLSNKSYSYLTPFYSERQMGGDAYLNRARRSPFTARFRQAILDFVGLLFSSGVHLEGVPDRIQQDFSNIDGRGMTFRALLPQLAIAALRRGHTYVLVDVAWGRIRWRHYGATQLINWSWGDRLESAYLQRTELVRSGKYGEESRNRILSLSPGEWSLLEVEKDQVLTLDSGIFGRTDGSAVKRLDEIPLVLFHSGEHPLEQGEEEGEPFESTPPLYSLADLNIAHYQTHSDHLHKIRKCCFPVYVRTGAMGDEGDLIIGPDAVVDVPPGGGFEVQEPKAESIAQSAAELRALEKAMDFLSLQFLVNPSDRQAAQVSVVQVAKMESGLSLFSTNFSVGITKALQVHGAYYGIPPEECGTAKIEANLFKQRGENPDLLRAYADSFQRLSELSESSPEMASKLEKVLFNRGFIEHE